MLHYGFDRGPAQRSGNALIVLLVILVAVGAAAYVALGSKSADDSEAVEVITHTVARERLVVSVTEDGNLESARNTEIKCQIEGGSTILYIVPDGTIVSQDDSEPIIRLDKSGIEELLRKQEGICEKAQAAKIKADEDAAAAAIAVQEYVEGTYEKEKQGIEASVIIAKENLVAAKNMLDHTQRMSRRGFATPLQVQADEFAVQRAQLDLKTAELAGDVLRRFTLKKMTTELEAAQKAAEALARSEASNVDLENRRKAQLEKQLSLCDIYAPQDGMVVYANERSRYRSTISVEQGSAVQQNQTLVRIPQLSEMQAKVLVNESKIDQLKAGMVAELKIQDREFTGRVESIANQPEPTSWFSAQVKEYAVIVSIDGDVAGLKPGMTAEVKITVAELDDQVTVPVSAVVNRGKKYFCWVKTPSGPERRELLLGKTNDRVIAIDDGVGAGDEVILNPRRAVQDAKELPLDDEDESEAESSSRARPETPKTSEPRGSNRTESNGGGKAEGGGSSSGERSPKPFSERDKNGDGRITKDEVDGRMAEYFDRNDTNGDGGIDPTEYSAMQQKMRERMKQGQGGGTASGGSE